jgi:hypothetical protein
LDEDKMLSFGLSLVGFDQTTRQTVCRELQLQRFCAFFGVGPKALACLYRDLSAQMMAIDPQYFLMTINWLKLYNTEHVLAGRWKLREETIRNHVQKYTECIQMLKEMKIVWVALAMKRTSYFSRWDSL